ncbi:hypothetical protein FRC14_003786 [Serendipita sp. 396]|nr:hypothetical protein FRC14_003786 [Serendipita sp. 396]
MIQLPASPREPHRMQTIRVGGTPAPYPQVTTPRPVSDQPAPGPSVIQLPGQPHDMRRLQTVRVGTPAQPIAVPETRRQSRTPPQSTFIRLPSPSYEPCRTHTVRVGGVPISPQQVVFQQPPGEQAVAPGPSVIQLPRIPQDMQRPQMVRVNTPAQPPARPDITTVPAPVSPPGVSVIQLPGGQSLGPQTVRVASPTFSAPQLPEPSIIRLPEQAPSRVATRTRTVKVTSPPPAAIPPSVIRLADRQEVPERPPTSQIVRVGGVAPQQPLTPIPPICSSGRANHPTSRHYNCSCYISFSSCSCCWTNTDAFSGSTTTTISCYFTAADNDPVAW